MKPAIPCDHGHESVRSSGPITRERLRVGLACVILGVGAAAFVCFLTFQVPERLFQVDLYDAYFGSDLPRTYREMVIRSSVGDAEARHPLYSLGTLGLTIPLRRLLGTPDLMASRVVISANAFLWASVLFTVCWTLTKKILDSVLLVLLALSSAAAIFWLPVPETFALGSTTILIPVALLCWERRNDGHVAHVVAQVASMSMTITNWMSGLIASMLKLRAGRGFSVALHALTLTFLLTVAQSVVLNRPNHFLALVGSGAHGRFMNTRPLCDMARDFFLTSLSPARVAYRITPQGDEWPKNDLPNVDVLEHAGPVIKTIAPTVIGGQRHVVLPWCLWSAVLAAGFYTTLRRCRESVVRQAILLCTLGQFLLHLFYGPETFMYCAHWMPLLVLMVAGAMQTRWRRVWIGCIVVLVVHNVAANVIMYRQIMNVFRAV